jgi:hypothetical protein
LFWLPLDEDFELVVERRWAVCAADLGGCTKVI